MGLVALAASGDGDRMREICAEHRGLVEALTTGAENAGELMRAHLQGTLELLRGQRA
jgi:DNA-binding GntR family transcriptional regulator